MSRQQSPWWVASVYLGLVRDEPGEGPKTGGRAWWARRLVSGAAAVIVVAIVLFV